MTSARAMVRRPRSGRSSLESPRAVRWRCSSPPHPERTRGLLLFGTVADFTSGPDAENEPIELDRIERLWGTEEYARLVLRGASSLADDERMVTWLASYTRRAASPGAAIALERMNHLMDASDILHAIHVPTLVIGRTGDLTFPIEDVQRTAEQVPGSSSCPDRTTSSSSVTRSDCLSRSSTS